MIVTGQQKTGLRQYIYHVLSSMGEVHYSVITSSSEKALDEVTAFFEGDKKFKLLNVDKLVSYREHANR